MTFAEAQKQLLALGDEVLTMKFGLRNMRSLMRALASPQQQFRSIHVGGTNGKGSVCALLASILRAARYRVGLFTSPHLVSIRERIEIDGRMISHREFAHTYERVRRTIESLRQLRHLRAHPTYFETITAMAFDFFARQRIDIAVLEVGMGGRLDSTNVVHPIVSVITNVDFDHERFLGNTLELIAREKAGIIKSRIPILTATRHPQARRVIRKVARAKKAPLHEMRSDVRISGVRLDTQSSRFSLRTPQATYPDLEIGLTGRHQVENAALAVRTIETASDGGLEVSPQAIVSGLRSARWPGRFERVSERPEIYLDWAHNGAGARALRRLLESQFSRRRMIVVYGAMRDKAVRKVVGELMPLSDVLIFTRPKGRRAATPQEIFSRLGELSCPSFLTANLATALQLARRLSRGTAVVVITGSLYLVGEARKMLRPALTRH